MINKIIVLILPTCLILYLILTILIRVKNQKRVLQWVQPSFSFYKDNNKCNNYESSNITKRVDKISLLLVKLLQVLCF